MARQIRSDIQKGWKVMLGFILYSMGAVILGFFFGMAVKHFMDNDEIHTL